MATHERRRCGPAAVSDAGRARDAAANARTLGSGEAFVVARDEVRLDLLHGVERDTDDDQQAGTTEAERHLEVLLEQRRDHADDRQVQRTRERDPRQHALDVLRRVLAGTDARDEAAALLQVVRDVDRD